MRRGSENASCTTLILRSAYIAVLTEPGLQPFTNPYLYPVPRTDTSKRLRLGCALITNSDGSYRQGGFAHNSENQNQLNEPDCADPLVLAIDREGNQVSVPGVCANVLRPHQREGVTFVFKCLMGMADYPPEFAAEVEDISQAQGCILADDMGLGKTLQSISVLWTLLKRSDRNGHALASKCLVVCPASLVGNWAAELNKWLKGECRHTAVNDATKAKVKSKIEGFRYDRMSKVLIVSYETLRLYIKIISKLSFGLLIADEAHRLKNSESGISQVIASLECPRRLFLTGTPLQNDLEEFFILSSLANPILFGDKSSARKSFVNPIIAGTDPNATDLQIAVAKDKLSQLAGITNAFVLRRSNVLLRSVLPNKIMAFVFCALAPLQVALYESLIRELREKKDGSALALGLIQSLLKICTHPLLVPMAGSVKDDWKAVVDHCKISDIDTRRALVAQDPMKLAEQKDGTWFISMSGKFAFIASLIETCKVVNDRVVIVSNFTQSLDLIEQICTRVYKMSVSRLDGRTSIKARQKLVESFNKGEGGFVFLLSSKAGGAGINLIGANRLVLIDPDWNPANDKQALARVWRDGQKKQCVIYRLFASGSIEEKVLQRQISKDNLSDMIVETNNLKTGISDDILKTLFKFDSKKISYCETHEILACQRCKDGQSDHQLIGGAFEESNVMTWSHTKGLAGELNRYDESACYTLKQKLAMHRFDWRPIQYIFSSIIASLPKTAEAQAEEDPSDQWSGSNGPEEMTEPDE